MIKWILIYTLNVTGTVQGYYLREPLIIDTFAVKEQCEAALNHLKETTDGSGQCWGEAQ